jgi:hypothetical protein
VGANRPGASQETILETPVGLTCKVGTFLNTLSQLSQFH